MQGWDSVMIDCDVELGGTDQLFNLHVGRDFQAQEGQRRQVIRTHPLITGLNGLKMSKSLGNAVGLLDSAREMTFSVMRLPDDQMHTWFVQLTRVPEAEIAEFLAGHPRAAKARLAREITAFFHDDEAAAEAALAFDREVRDKVLPDDIPETPWRAEWGEEILLPNLLKEVGLVQTTGEGRRLIQQGGVRIDGTVVGQVKTQVGPPGSALLLQVGKKRFARVLPK